MADNGIKIPKLNPIQFYELDRQHTDQRYNVFPVNEDLYWFSIKRQDAKRPFFQKWQFNDIVNFQLHTTKTFIPIIELIDRYHNVHHAWIPASFYSIPGNVTLHNGIYVNLYTRHFKFSFSDALNIEPGVYWLKLTIPIDTVSGGTPETQITYISDAILLSAKHQDTALIQYRHKSNKFGVIFEQSNATFSIRLPSTLCDFEPTSSDTTYKDQVEEVSQLSSFPAEIYKLYVGGSTGITEQLYNILNRAFSCSDISYDEEAIVKDDSAKWETVRTPRNPLVWASLAVRKKSNEDSTIKFTKASLKLFTKTPPEVFPHYYVHNVSFTDGTRTVRIPSAPIMSPTHEANYLTTLSNSFSAAEGLTGTFSFSGADLLYTPGPGEAFHTVATSNVLLKSFQFERSSLTSNTLSLNFEFPAIDQEIGIVWDLPYYDYTTYKFNNTVEVVNRNYGAGSFTVYVFHSDNIDKFSIINVADLNGNLPASLTEFTITGYLSSALDFSLFDSCSTTIQKIDFNGGSLTAINSINPVFETLTEIDFRNNSLTQTSVQLILQGILNAAIAAAGTMDGGVLMLESQTPPAPLTVFAALYKTDLTSNHSWTITND